METENGTRSLGVLGDRRKKLEKLRETGVDPFLQDYSPEHRIGDIRSRCDDMDNSQLEALEEQFCIAGRVMGKRDFGKVTFLDVIDRSGKIQCLVQVKSLDEHEANLFRNMDVGDHLGVKGPLFRTRTGELTIKVEKLGLLSKSLRPLPEKWHGIKDVEARYRQRYLDMIMNPEVIERFRTRGKIVRWIRDFMDARGFQEVETPMMQPLPGGAEARPFQTHHNALDMELYLRIAPELYLKRLIVGGMERVYEINRNFRNEGVSTQHNPEFTMLEFYQAYATFEDLVLLTEEMIEELAKKLDLGDTITFDGTEIDISRPWKKVKYLEALTDIGGVPQEKLSDMESLREIAQANDVDLQKRDTLGKILAKLFDALVEPHLISPTFVTHYPVEISPLSRRNRENPELVDRFELFIAGREIANAFSELNDPDDQRKRFEAQAAQREAGDEEAPPLDEDYLRALEHGMPPTAGEGMGIDRLVMLLTDSPSIRDVILFPQLRREGQ